MVLIVVLLLIVVEVYQNIIHTKVISGNTRKFLNETSFFVFIFLKKTFMTYKGLPVFNITIDFESEEGLELVSLVDEPAVMESFLKFKSDEEAGLVKLVFTSDEEQHIISGVSLLADTPIYRCDDGINGYYVVFTKQTIKDLVEKYNRENRTNITSLQHNGQPISDCIMVESYFIDKERGICPKEFAHCPDGSWITSYKVTNDELWNEIKTSGQLNGFSVEISCQLEPAMEGQHLEEEPMSEEEKFFESLLEWLAGGEFGLKKKFKVEKSEIINAIDRKRAIMVDEGGDKAVEYWPSGLGKKDGKDIVVLYNPKTKEWTVQPLSTMGETIVTKEPIGKFDYSDPTYKEIIDDDSVTVSRSVISGDRFLDAIKNKQWVQISYDDEQPDPATGYRQCIVVAYGTTSAGNVAIRCYEQFGDTRTICPDYKIFLLKRIRSFKPMLNVEPWTDDILDGRYHSGGDKNLSYPLIYAYTLGE